MKISRWVGRRVVFVSPTLRPPRPSLERWRGVQFVQLAEYKEAEFVQCIVILSVVSLTNMFSCVFWFIRYSVFREIAFTAVHFYNLLVSTAAISLLLRLFHICIHSYNFRPDRCNWSVPGVSRWNSNDGPYSPAFSLLSTMLWIDSSETRHTTWGV
jgi:hypothetical protein